MQIRKWLALLVSAALALSLLAGCGNGSKALSDVIADLLSGQYANVTVEIDPDLEGDLRQAVHEGETDAEIRAALEKILGSGVSFRLIGDGQQGDSAWNLILYPGSDPDAAARSAFTEWNKVFGSLPRDGQYTAQIAMIETENGYAILVQATVDKAASRDDDDDDDEPEDEKVEGNGFTYNVTKNTITVGPDNQDGLQNLLTGQDGEDEKITAARNSGFEKITIELAAGSYSVKDTFGDENTPFMGTLQGKGRESTTITLNEGSSGLFAQIGVDGGPDENNGTVENITFEVQTNITDTYAGGGNHFAGAVAGMNFGNITDCMVTINGSISATDGSCCAGAVAGLNHGNITNCDVKLNGHNTINASGSLGSAAAGGLVGWNYDTITDCTVTIDGFISATSDISNANAGGIAGGNEGEGKIEGNSKVTIESGGSITATSELDGARAGGLAGWNAGTVTDDWTPQIDLGTIQATVDESTASVPDFADPDQDGDPNTDTQGRALAGTKIGFEWRVGGGGGPVGS